MVRYVNDLSRYAHLMAAEGLRRRPGGRSADVRRRVLEATLDELTATGYAGLSIGAVADRAGVHKTTVYRWWPSKGALLAAALLEQSNDLEVQDTGRLGTDLLALSDTAPRSTDASDPIALAVAVTCALDAARDDPDVAAARAQLWDRRLAIVRQALQRAEERGEIATGVDSEMVLDVLFGAFHTRVVARGVPYTAEYAGKLQRMLFGRPSAEVSG